MKPTSLWRLRVPLLFTASCFSMQALFFLHAGFHGSASLHLPASSDAPGLVRFWTGLGRKGNFDVPEGLPNGRFEWPREAVPTVPEPGVLPLLAGGIGWLLLALRRRRRLAAVAALGAVALMGCTKADKVASEVALGDHLVNDIALCADCHTPRLADGRFDPARPLEGAPLGFVPTVEMPWAPAAPRIAGLPSLTDAQAIEFLTTGNLPGGRQLRPPMPSYRFSPEEARAVVAYLRTMAPKK